MGAPQTASVMEARRARQAYQAEAAKVLRQYPELHLRVFATPVGMKLVASLYWPETAPYNRRVEVLTEAIWQPREVTEELVVDWGQRALAKWLADRISGHVPPMSGE